MRRAAILLSCLAIFSAGCQYFFDDDDRGRRNRPGQGEPDASCGEDHGDADAGFFPDGGLVPDGGEWPWADAGYPPPPDAGPDW